jgi:hypothetical protein
VRNIREHAEAFIVAELERTPLIAATRHRSPQQLFNWLDGEIETSPMAKMRPLRRGSVLLFCLRAHIQTNGRIQCFGQRVS